MKHLPYRLWIAVLLAMAAMPASAQAPPAAPTTLGPPLAMRFRAVPERPPLRLLTGRQPLLLAHIHGTSMEPLLLDGELAVYIPMSHVATVRVGEVAIYESARCPLSLGQSSLVVHRVVQDDGGVYLFRGDANLMPDICRVTRDMLVGVVIGPLWATGDPAESVQ